MRIDCKILLCVPLLALVCAAAALAPCGVISTTVSNENGTYNVLYNVSNGAAFTRLLPAWTRDVEEFYISEMNAVFYFGPTSAFSISFATGVIETYPKWKSPYINDHGLGISMYLIGFDATKFIIYAGFVGDTTVTNTIYASDFAAQKWVPLTQFTPTTGEKGYALYNSLTADGSAITLLNSSSGHSHGDFYTLTNYNVTTLRWGAALDMELKYQPESTQIYARSDNSVVVWMEPPTGKGIVAAAYSIVNGKQVASLSLGIFNPTDASVTPVATKSSALLLPGCPLDWSPHASTLDVLLYDINAGALAYTFTVPLADGYHMQSCDFAWSSIGCGI